MLAAIIEAIVHSARDGNECSYSVPNNIGDFSLRANIVSNVTCEHSLGIVFKSFIAAVRMNSQNTPKNK